MIAAALLAVKSLFQKFSMLSLKVAGTSCSGMEVVGAPGSSHLPLVISLMD